jgi:hypothetical protein
LTYLVFTCRGLIGLVFAVSVVTKLRSAVAVSEFVSWLAALPMPTPVLRRRPAAVAAAMVTVEFAIVALIAVPSTARAGLALAAATLAVFSVGTLLAVRRGTAASCQCFGRSQAPLSIRHVARDLLLCLVAVAGLTADIGAAGHATPAGIVISLIGAAVVALFVVFLDDVSALFTEPTA